MATSLFEFLVISQSLSPLILQLKNQTFNFWIIQKYVSTHPDTKSSIPNYKYDAGDEIQVKISNYDIS